MIFEKELLSFNLLEVLSLKQRNVNMSNNGRNFSALSFRFRADTVLSTETREYRMRDNDVCYIPARLDYARASVVDDLIVIHFDALNYSTREIEYFSPSEPEVMAELFRKILDCWNQKPIGYKHQCSAMLCEIFAACYQQNFVAQDTKSKIRPSMEYLLANYRKSDLTVKEIADRSFMSEVYFRKLFKAEYGVSPQKYIINLRMQYAEGLISTGYYSIEEIAYMSGYSDSKYFSVEFKRIKGVSPSKYTYNYHK